MDASHLHLTAASASASSIDALAMIHDDYGTHAANAEQLFNIIRKQFYIMYSMHDPIADLCARYDVLPAPPTKGTLDIGEVLHSPFFFA